MRKDSSENTSGDSWAIGTKFSKNSKEFIPADHKKQKTQEQQQQQQPPHKYIPKLKDRNPFSVIKQIPEQSTEQQIQQEIVTLLTNFNTQQYNICEFMSEAIKLNDYRGISNNEIIEYILSQTKTKEFFSNLLRNQTNQIINTILHSIKNNNTYQNKESCIRMLGHILFLDNEVDNQALQSIYSGIAKLAFDQPSSNNLEQQQQQTTGGSGGSQSSQSKIQRLALNCLANMLLRPSNFLKQNSDAIYLKLKTLFEQQMRKINQSFKSKRYISMLTTIIRALQLSMNEIQKLTINDNECVKLFLQFYKLLFLGSPFAEKMLNIKFEESKQKGKNQSLISIDQEELKSNSGSFLIDTSDISSSDGGEGTKHNKGSPNNADSITSGDPYQKIKTYAALCLQYLFKSNNKALFNYWYLIFPSYFMKQQSEFAQYLTSFNEKKEEFFSKVSSIVSREPTIFYLLKAKENNAKLKCTICFTISIMLENQMIQKWQGQLEKEQQVQAQATFVSMANILGQFLRFLHYQMLYLIDTETDSQLSSQFIKTAGTLLHITPYSKMNKGLASSFVNKLVEKLNSAQTDLSLKIQLVNTLAIAFNIPDVIEELDQSILSQDSLLSSLFKQDQKSENFLHSPEFLQLVQRLAKNYPQRVLQAYDESVNLFLIRLLKSHDKKKINNALKIIEEWIKNYKQQSLLMDDGEEEQKSETHKSDQNPFMLESFKDCLRNIVDILLLSKNQQQSDVSIAILSVLSNLDCNQWKLTFNAAQTQKILGFIHSVKTPPLLKAASVKLLGYLVYFDLSTFDETFINKVYSLVFENSTDSNLNVQIRNSWTLANLSFINKQVNDEYLAQETLIISLNYAMSAKEKVASNGIRSLGYYLQNINIQTLKTSIISSIKKSQLQLQKLNPNISSELSLDSILLLIIDNLESKSPKIAWNSCVALGNILDNQTLDQSEIIYSKHSINPLLKALEKSTNFKTKIHSASTLLKFKSFQPFQDQGLIKDVWTSLMNCMEQINQAVYTTSDQKYAQSLELAILQLWKQFSTMQLTAEQKTLYDNALIQFFNSNAFALLQIITVYLRRELKIPEYSALFDKDLLLQETTSLFLENEFLESKLELLKQVIIKFRNTIKEHEDVHVSFGVFEGTNTLANTDIREYRGLEVLKGTKTSFQPSFDHSSSASD